MIRGLILSGLPTVILALAISMFSLTVFQIHLATVATRFFP
jgi:hypothetical protein